MESPAMDSECMANHFIQAMAMGQRPSLPVPSYPLVSNFFPQLQFGMQLSLRPQLKIIPFWYVHAPSLAPVGPILVHLHIWPLTILSRILLSNVYRYNRLEKTVNQ